MQPDGATSHAGRLPLRGNHYQMTTLQEMVPNDSAFDHYYYRECCTLLTPPTRRVCHVVSYLLLVVPGGQIVDVFQAAVLEAHSFEIIPFEEIKCLCLPHGRRISIRHQLVTFSSPCMRT